MKCSEAVGQRYSVKERALSTCAGVSYNKIVDLETCNLIKK